MIAEAKARSSGKRATPPINYTVRGDKRRALAVARDPALLDAAVMTFTREVRSSGDTSDENVKTWMEFHAAVSWTRYGLADPCPVLPLMPMKLTVIGSIFKIGGHRSTKNYLSAIKKNT